LSILAEFCGDQACINAFRSGADLHRVTASEVFNVAVDQVSREQRDFAKRLNFGVVYGIGAQRFSIMTGLGVLEAEGVLKKYFATYRQLDSYLTEAANRAVRERQARTGSGRLVRFRYDEQDRQQISMTKRNGKNTPIQGTSADILKRALRLLTDELGCTNAQIVNIIHEEIVGEADAGEAEDVAMKVERAMVAAGEEYVKTVPVKVETEIADEWVK
jgi:DNA polymerase-1